MHAIYINMKLSVFIVVCKKRHFPDCSLAQFNREGVLLLRGLDSRLSKDLSSDLQKLRCKVFRIQILLLSIYFKWETKTRNQVKSPFRNWLV